MALSEKNLESRKENLQPVRKMALSSSQKEANKILNVFKYPAPKIGDTVKVHVPCVDRA